ncbi:type III polyketide synthase [Stappia sp. GBMRC 2046]|uniref:Type III polyketide synthase n=1 Tax=Stappia sediminis TaxID=2692190 RepID=A0A7X3LWU1_9HYPH|nr:type III polyketide synthase [Stappia sediminis]MXN66567.1 type III polyketide synthase [Stappia sediminis]
MNEDLLQRIHSWPALGGLATATPAHFLKQDEAAARAGDIFGPEFPDFEALRPVFVNSGIEKRHLAMPVEWYLEPRDWSQRTDAYLTVATELFVRAAREALDKAQVTAEEVDAVVTVSSTGIATPSLEARAAADLGLRSDILRVPVFGLGCAGGVSGLALASRLASGEQGLTVLVVVVELCSIAFRSDKPTKANIVATALFGDGAAAAVIGPRRKEAQYTVGPGTQHMWPDTLGIMGWNVDPNGFEVVFDRAIPPFARRHMRGAIEGFRERLSIEPGEVARYLFHPGGEKVLQAIEAAMEFEPASLAHERDILRDFGNMSAPTALFVLERALQSGEAGLSLLTALGPGFTASCIPIGRAW